MPPRHEPLTIELRGEALHFPTLILSGEFKSVVKAVGASLPKLNRRRDYAKPSPMRGFWDFAVFKSFLIEEKVLGEPCLSRHGRALRRNPGAQLAPVGTAVEVNDAFGRRSFSALPAMRTCLSNSFQKNRRHTFSFSSMALLLALL